MARADSTSTNAESIGDLYARIGLNFDNMDNAFLDVERSLQQNIARLNRENNIIRLQSQVELTGLDATSDAERIFEIQSRRLNQTLNNQRARLELLEAQLEDTARRTGANSDATQRAQIAYENARLSVARLENQLRELNESQNNDESWIDKIVAFSQKAAPVMSVASRLIDVFGIINDAVNNLVDNFRELQRQGAAFNLPLNVADDFARKIRLAGGELEDIGGYLRGMTDALIKGEVDDPEYIALKRYGETIFTATGQLKDYVAIWEAVHRAFKKAQAEGKEIEFLQMTGGESGVTDALLALQNWDKASRNANKIVKAHLDFSDLEKATDTSNQLSEQMDELGKAIGALFQPYTTAAAQGFFDILAKGTGILNRLNLELAEVNKQTAELPSVIFSPLEYLKKTLAQEQSTNQKVVNQIKKMANGTAELDKLFETSAGLDKAHAELKERLKKQAQDKKSDPFQQYAIQRTQDLKDAVADLRVAIDYESEYQQAVRTAQLERERALRQIVVGDEERAAIEAKYRADVETAEKAHNDKLEDMARETAAIMYEISHTAYQKEIQDIENWKEKALEDLGEYKDAIGDKNQWLKESAEITAQALAKETQAFENEIDRIKNANLTLAEKLFKKTHSQADWDTYQAEKEAQKYLDEGIYNPSDIVQMLGLEYGDILKRATKDLDYSKVPEINFALPNIDFYGDLSAAVDNVIDSFKDLDAETKKASGFFGVPDVPQGYKETTPAAEPLNLDNLIEFDKNLYSAGIAARDFTASLDTAMDKFLVEYGDSAGQPYKSGNFELPPMETARADDAIQDKIKTAVDKLKGAESPNNFLDFPTLPQPDTRHFDAIAAKVADLTQIAGSIAHSLNQRQAAKNQPPQITLNVSPTFTLSGSYILTQAQVNQMQDDITTNVANAIKDAVTQGINSINLYPSF